tara:strand:- start:250 stop:627 length:378 start_codon:yes stop_codon:yes gene_type:complete
MNKEECNDKNCPKHGKITLRGRTFNGKVVSTKAHRSAIVEWGRLKFIPKYERYTKKKTRIQVHNPECMDIKDGENVEIKECKPLSKTKRFVITKRVEKVKKEKIRELTEEKSIKKINNKKPKKKK